MGEVYSHENATKCRKFTVVIRREESGMPKRKSSCSFVMADHFFRKGDVCMVMY